MSKYYITQGPSSLDNGLWWLDGPFNTLKQARALAKYPNTTILKEVSVENKPALRVAVVKATHKNYGYSLTIVEGEKPSYIMRDAFMWFKHKSDAQIKANEINERGSI